MEIWKTTHIRNDYEVSNQGRVRRIKRSPKRYGMYAYLTPRITKKGYVDVSIDRKLILLHRLVAIAFIPNPNNYPMVLHKDNVTTNNIVDNLMWGNASMNTKQAYDDGLIKNHKTPYTQLEKCPNCGKVGNLPNMKRWHFDNCKLKYKI